MDCLFCKIISGEFLAHKVYEDEYILAFLDIKPLTKGHSLIIPKKHCQDIFDINKNDLQKVIVIAKLVSEKIKNKLKADGIRISQSNGVAAGQDVMHYHLHVIPRYADDGLSNDPMLTMHSPMADQKELENILEKIKL